MIIRQLLEHDKPPMELLLSADPSREKVEAYLRRGECYAAFTGEEISGVYVLLPTRPDMVELVNVAVAEQHQGHGLGKKLVQHAVQTAALAGFRTMEVGTGNSSVNQLALYQKCGFRIVGVELDFFTRHYPEAIYENGILCRDMLRLTKELHH
ncbi:GNAT family N-acetyltransferase [Paenibacillus typhae]|uniref:GNAT family N-acetyltransferase n=1 Tax=Paenibacillus typhae TaxID=1174501 RepID=UPI001C8E262C|nr:GNAT family N-acetyltransferase [Paenibacillus typhae]MBY0011249.1 GNAT family N-acetyltransferase [Paenibacillus typhae]